MTSIWLYEDNAGGLYLQREGTSLFVIGGLEHIGIGAFNEDATVLAAGDISDWELPIYRADGATEEEAEADLAMVHGSHLIIDPDIMIDTDTLDFIACWSDGEIELRRQPGTAGRLYVGLTKEQAESIPC